MERKRISVSDFVACPIDIWQSSWMLLSSGDFAAGKFNSMTVSWGSLGVMWGKPIAMCMVRPQRYTRQFMDQGDSFSLCIFPTELKHFLDVLGCKSGRDMDKVNHSGFTAEAATKIATPVYKEAELALECKKIYTHDLDPKNFLAEYIPGLYKNDYHRMYLGEIVAVTGVDRYRLRRQGV